jgi:hypothetical protein
MDRRGGNMKHYSGTEKLERLDGRPATDLDGEYVFMDTERGEYQLLKGTALYIWESLENPKTLDELCSDITSEFDISKEQCLEDVIPFIGELEEIGLIKIHTQ